MERCEEQYHSRGQRRPYQPLVPQAPPPRMPVALRLAAALRSPDEPPLVPNTAWEEGEVLAVVVEEEGVAMAGTK